MAITSRYQTLGKFEVCSFSRSKDISWGVKLSNWSRDPDQAYFGTVSCLLTLDITYNHTKFDDSSFSHSRDI